MHTFRDNNGREWVIVIHVTAVKRVRGFVDVDLYGLVDEGFQGLGELLGDPCQFVDVLYVLCKEEADQRGISDEDFGRAMAGDCLESATEAFLAELTDFFPSPRVRAALRKLTEAGHQMRDKLLDHATLTLDGLDLDQEVARLIASSGGSPGSLGSTPARSPSDNLT